MNSLRDNPVKAALMGFAAAAVSVALFHQGALYLLGLVGVTPWKPWSMAPIPPLAVPSLLSQMFWGGLWGVLFALIWQNLPGRSLTVKGALFGIAGPLLAGRWIIVPLVKGDPLFAGLNANTMMVQAIIITLFGLGLAWIYGRLSGVLQT